MLTQDNFVIICAGDVGGARALMPIIESFQNYNYKYLIINNGFLSESLSDSASKNNLINNNNSFIEDLYFKKKVSIYIFATSVKDDIALKWARFSKKHDVPTFCLLDSAIRIKDRMELDALPTFHPEYIFLQDEESFESALMDGFSKKTLLLSGQPALKNLYEFNNNWNETSYSLIQNMNKWINRKKILFVSEPVKSDQGSSIKSPKYRGYDEENVIELICKYFEKYNDKIQIGVLPHPRDDINRLIDIFDKYHNKLEFNLFKCRTGRDAILFCDGIIGMASILLYEAWLVGKPVFSLQPNVLNKDYLYLERKKDMSVIKNEKELKSFIPLWINRVFSDKKYRINKKELLLHKNSPKMILSEISKHL